MSWAGACVRSIVGACRGAGRFLGGLAAWAVADSTYAIGLGDNSGASE